jgi:hypothetical protein
MLAELIGITLQATGYPDCELKTITLRLVAIASASDTCQWIEMSEGALDHLLGSLHEFLHLRFAEADRDFFTGMDLSRALGRSS